MGSSNHNRGDITYKCQESTYWPLRYPFTLFFFGGVCLTKLSLLSPLLDCIGVSVLRCFLFFFFGAVCLRNGKQENEVDRNNVLLNNMDNRIIEKL